MISYREMATALRGAWRLARLDPQGLSDFNATAAGFWRSFFAAVISAPVHFLITAMDYLQEPAPAVSDARLVTVHVIAYVINWTAFPLAMAPVTRMLGRDDAYIRYIVASNWANVIEAVLFLPAAVLAFTGVQPLGLLPLVATVLLLFYQWYVARTALAITGFQAAAIVALDLLIDIVLMTVVQLLLMPVANV